MNYENLLGYVGRCIFNKKWYLTFKGYQFTSINMAVKMNVIPQI